MAIFQSLKDAFLPLLLILLPQVRLLGHGRHHPKRILTGKAHHLLSRARIFKLLRSPRIDSKEPIPPGCVACVGNLSPTMGAWNQIGIGGIGLLYRPACLCSFSTQFQTRFLESIPRPIAGLQFSTLTGRYDNPVPTQFLAPKYC